MLGMLLRDRGPVCIISTSNPHLRESPTHDLSLNMTKDKDPVEELPRVRILEERPTSLSEPLPREKLNTDLQKIVDEDDVLWDSIYDGQYESLSYLMRCYAYTVEI